MSPPGPSHPDPAVLREFAGGRLDAVEIERVASHLDRCPQCLEALEKLEEAPLVARLRAVSESGPCEDLGDAPLALRRDSRREQRERMASTPDPIDAGASSVPSEVGRYHIIREAGRGGMGVVFEARDRVLGRPVALKMILAGEFASPDQRLRLRREAELAARVHHPHIVQVFEVGEYNRHPFLVQEWIDGGSLAEQLGDEPWPAPLAARLVEAVALAIAFAHRRGIVHRDLKPANILLTTHDTPGDGIVNGRTPKVADFGLARALEDDHGLTATGTALGTPEYMAPEQAMGGPAGPASDIYALGAILYRLLTGRPPFTGDSALDVIRASTNEEPVAPRRLRSGLSRDIETIVLKALEKEPRRRYETAQALAEDLRLFREGLPIRARPPSRRERLVKWGRRHPELATLGVLLVSVTVVAFAGITSLLRATETARTREAAAAAEARRNEQGERRARYRAGIAAVASSIELQNLDSAESLLHELPESLRDWEWHHLASEFDNATHRFRPDEGPVGRFALSPREDLFAYTLAGHGEVRLRSSGNGSDLRVLTGLDAPVESIAFSADGSLVAAGTPGGTIAVWTVKDGARLAFEGRTEHWGLIHVQFSPDGRWIAAAFGDRSSHLYRLDGQGHSMVPASAPVVFSRDSRHVASRYILDASIWEVATGKKISDLTERRGAVTTLAASPTDPWFAVACRYPWNDILVKEIGTGRTIATLKGHTNSVDKIVISPDGKQAATGSIDQTTRLWDLASGRCLTVLRGNRGRVETSVFSPDGKRVFTSALDRTIRAWDPATGELLAVLRGRPMASLAPELGNRGHLLSSLDAEGTIHTWDVDLTLRRGIFRGHSNFVYDVAFTPDGQTVASASWDGTVRLWDTSTGEQRAVLRHQEPIVVALAVAPDGQRIASVARDARVALWSPPYSRPDHTIAFERTPGGDGGVAFSPDGRTLAIAGNHDGSIKLHDAATGALIESLGGHRAASTRVAYSPDGHILASIDVKGGLVLHDLGRRRPWTVVQAHERSAHALAFHPSGRLVATAAEHEGVVLWEVPSGKALGRLKQERAVYGLAFNPSGTRLAGACADNVIRLWDIAHREVVAELRGHEAYVHAVAFSRDGTRLVSGSGDFTVRLWDSR